MRKYEKYKKSGVQWIGEIPQNWFVSKIKYSTYVKGRVGWKGLKSSEFLEEGYAYLVTGTDFNSGKIDWKNCYSIDVKRYEEDPYIQLHSDDLLITKDGTIGKVAHIDKLKKPTCLNSGIFVVRPLNKKLYSKFLYYILISNLFKDFFDFNSTGATILHLYQNVFEKFDFPIPSVLEQTQIAKFLDYKTAQIDAIINKKEQLIEKLKLQRQAIINEAVTGKKIWNGNSWSKPKEVKDSGIDWLGNIPKHWTFSKAKRNTYMKGRIGWQGLKQDEFIEEGPFLITGMNFKDGVIRWDEVYHISQERYDQAPEIQLRDGDVLMTKDGTIGKLLFVENLPGPASLNSHLLVLRCTDGSYIPKFLYYQLMSQLFIDHIELHKTGTTFFGITQEAVGKYQILLPSINEQEQIIKYIESKLLIINELSQKVKKQIGKLKQYRQSIISEAVTGKIDLRDWKQPS
ncbi:restriction endonuclease subunit S [Marinifilum fragile]|uniref:restriction endonuclease subunit S n=1 Tax=Marinifilum fragile TaxID=570161 RepID=UPI002AA90F1C|nr:restriction endonuclease subunit S [Marinifilum fragile]